jgi:hypothetical protein
MVSHMRASLFASQPTAGDDIEDGDTCDDGDDEVL